MSGARRPVEPPDGDVGSARLTPGSPLIVLATEQAEVHSLVEGAGSARWSHPTTPGWTVWGQIAHVALVDDAAAMSIPGPNRFSDTPQADQRARLRWHATERESMEIGQAYAGPPGAGPARRSGHDLRGQ
jgi:hypothetical protein